MRRFNDIMLEYRVEEQQRQQRLKEVMQRENSRKMDASTLVITGFLPPTEVATRMRSKINCGNMYDFLEHWSTAEKDNFLGCKTPTDKSKLKYFITVKNISSKEEYMYPKPVESLDLWQVLFINHPIFAGIDVAVEPDFPELQAPATHDLWSCTRMYKKRDHWEIYVSIIPHDAPLDKIPSLGTDCVFVHLRSPDLPTCNEAFLSRFTTVHERRECTKQFAMLAMARSILTESGLQSKLHMATDAAQPSDRDKSSASLAASMVHGDAILQPKRSMHMTFYGGFVSNLNEPTCGSVVLPQLLRHLSFLLPLLKQDDGLMYNVSAPHRYGYALQIPNLSGWSVSAAVNMLGCSIAIDRVFEVFDSRLRLLAKDRQHSAFGSSKSRLLLSDLPSYDFNTPSSGSASGLSLERYLEELDFFHSKLLKVKDAIEDNYNDAYVHFMADAAVSQRNKEEVKKLEESGGAIDLKKIATNRQKKYMSFEMWKCLMELSGIVSMMEPMSCVIEQYRGTLDIARGNRFLALWTQKKPATAEDIDNCVVVLFDMCYGLATLVVDALEKRNKKGVSFRKQFAVREEQTTLAAKTAADTALTDAQAAAAAAGGGAPPANIPVLTSAAKKAEAAHKKAAELLAYYTDIETQDPSNLIFEIIDIFHNVIDKSQLIFEPQKIKDFLINNCRDISPRDWCAKANTILIKDPITFFRLMISEPSILKAYVPAALKEINLFERIQSSIHFKKEMILALESYNQCCSVYTPTRKVIADALAYAVFCAKAEAGINALKIK